ncbi:1-acyl-sn-glycerol-3-phosphate acyltransferase [bacterium]|nr:1-acyl-sn-glycerol-3-phosphate acyltransferase [bacterium]
MPSSRIIDWLLTPIYFVIFLTILVLFDLLQRIALYCLGKTAHLRCVKLLNLCLFYSLRIIRTKIEVNHQAKLEAHRSYLIVANHQSLFDISIIAHILAPLDCSFIAKKELSRNIPSVSFNLKHGRNLVIDRADGSSAVKEMIRFSKQLQQDHFGLVIFPEGTRAKDGVLKPFKQAGLVTLLRTLPEIEVVPVTIDGCWRIVAHRGLPLLSNQVVRISIAQASTRKEGQSPEDFAGQIERTIASQFMHTR